MLLIIIINSVFSRNYLSFILAKRWNIVYKIRLRSHKKHWSKIHFVFKCFPEKFIQCVHMLICAVKHNFHTSPSVGIEQQITTTRACSQKWLLSKSFISIITKLAGLPTDCLVNCFNQAVISLIRHDWGRQPKHTYAINLTNVWLLLAISGILILPTKDNITSDLDNLLKLNAFLMQSTID